MSKLKTDRRARLYAEELRRQTIDRGIAAKSSDPAAVLYPLQKKIQRALDVTNEETWDDLLHAVRAGHAVVFAEGGSVLVASGSEEILNIWIVAGRRDEVVLLSRAAALYAKDHGFTRMTALSRPPIAEWAEVKSDGWQKKAVRIERSVSP